MSVKSISALAVSASLFTLAAVAQEEGATDKKTPSATMGTIQETTATNIEPATDENAETDSAGEQINPDEMADLLNSQQQLQQSFTLKRTIDGKIVESEKRTVTFSREEPYRETEARQPIKERLKAAFDGEVLTRKEAFEEAKLDFTVADINRDGQMTADEFTGLVKSWRDNEARQAAAPNTEIARQRQYEAFLAEISADTAETQDVAYAKQKFSFLSGMSETVSREDYVREYLLDFDSMDADKDTLLKGDELMRFRALNRGETLNM